jgi:hypothetical protein
LIERRFAVEKKEVLSGKAIVVADRGFVYVGDVEVSADWCVITKAKNVRKWGTSKGLGELALNGPLADTILDDVGTVRVPMRAVISLIDTEASKWTS